MDNKQKDNENNRDKGVSSFKYNPSLFNSDYSLYIVYRRLENLTAAIYLIIKSVPNFDTSLAHSIRDATLKCLTDMARFIGSTNNNEHLIETVVSDLLQLGSFLNISFWSGYVSEMNATLIQKELVKIYDDLSHIVERYKTKFQIDPAIFSEIDLEVRHQKNARDIVSTDNKRHSYIRQNKDQFQNKNEDSSDSRLKRREVILRLLREKSNLSIKDFSIVISEYSEKTIQRELTALVQEGMVRKEGERRWSTYSLVT